MVLSLGADRAIDYTATDFTRTGDTYDAVLDIVGNRTVRDLLRVLVPGGRVVVHGFTSMRQVITQSLFGPGQAKRQGKRFIPPSSGDPTPEHMQTLAELLASGSMKPVVEKVCSLEEAPQAVAYVEEGHARGKVVIRVDGD
jgi:NADPH:quinone reductase-like Zn-dependent oxidoreductase